jgi:alkaline phosphatase
VYDATPAAFTIHEESRYKAQAIVDQYAAFQPEVLLGGGADYFLPRGKGAGKRNDSVDLMGAFQANGYTIARSAQELKSARGRRLLGLFADADMMFEIDAENGMQPSLADMAVAALKMLEPLAAKGFVLLIENENVDTAGHANDAAALMRALWAFDDAGKVALDFQRRAPDTLLIVTGDHETGGFSPTAGGDAQLRMLARITISLGAAEAKLGSAPSADALDRLLKQHFPGFTLGADARERILKGKASQQSGVTQNALASMVAKQAGYSWATTGHTSEPVAVGAIGPGAELFRGYQDNADFGKHLHTLLRARTVSGEP